jgi:hypothetical protein
VELAEFAQKSLSLLSPLGPVIYRAMEPSIEDARKYLAEPRKFDGYVFADLTRYHTCCRLESATLPEGIKFQRLQNNGMGFNCHGSVVRVWKGDEDGELRGPGTSKTKKEYFDQEFLLFAPDPAQARYAVVWDYDFMPGLLTLSLACPKNFDQYRPWNNPDCHFYIEFPHAATEIAPSPEFSEPSPDGDIELEPKRKVKDEPSTE